LRKVIETPRNSLADLLKGLAVVFMVQVHLMELFASPDIYNSAWGKASLFLGGPPAAPVFMAVMGYFIASSQKPALQGFYRGVKLIFWGLLLNIGINLHLFLHIFTGDSQLNPLEYIFGADILFLAGFSMILIVILKKLCKENIIFWGFGAILTVAISQFFSSTITDSEPWKYILALLCGNYTWSYFPIFPWLAYPLAGYIFYLSQDKINGFLKAKNKRLILLIISCIILLFTLNKAIDISWNLPQYYHHGLLFFLWIVLFLSLYVALLSYFLKLAQFSQIQKFLCWCGKNVTALYIFQWLIIGNLATWLYKSQGAWELAGWFFTVMILTCGSVYGWISITRHKQTDIL
jgi:uncharacterized membrane protein